MSTPAAVDAQLLVSTCLMVEERGPAAAITPPVTSHCRTVKPWMVRVNERQALLDTLRRRAWMRPRRVVAASQRSPPRVVNMVARPKRSIPAALSSASAVHSAASTGCSEKPRTDGLDCLRFRDSSWATTYAFFIPSTGCVPATTSSLCHTRATSTIASTGIHDCSRRSSTSS